MRLINLKRPLDVRILDPLHRIINVRVKWKSGYLIFQAFSIVVLATVMLGVPASAAPLTLRDLDLYQLNSGSRDSSPKIENSTKSTLFYSPWVRVCPKEQKSKSDNVCFTVAIGRTDAGDHVLSAALVEPKDGAEKYLRVTVPLGVQLPPGTRLSIDQSPSVNASYIVCDVGGCIADYKAADNLITQLKAGQHLFVQTVRKDGQIVNYVLPLADFAKANSGPPIDVDVFDAQQKQMQESLKKFASKKFHDAH